MTPEQITQANAESRSKPATEDVSWQEFREQCRRQMARPLAQRIKYGFCKMHKPVLDDAEWRAFDTMAEYRAWCIANLPAYLGFQPAVK
jgi:hypothetical protein